VVLAGLVVMGSLLPAGSPVVLAAGRLPLTDKTMHFLAYLGLAGLPVLGLRKRGLRVGLAVFGLGCLLEFAQQFSPGRSVDVWDLVANGAGVGCGVWLAAGLRGWVG
jgi:VanZ family protein